MSNEGGLREGVLWLGVAFLYYMLWAWVVPPWQAPDEPQHYEYAAVLSVARRPIDGQDILPEKQGEILRDLAANRFWHFLGAATPTPLPATFADATDPYLGTAGTQIGDEPPSYYVVPAMLFNLVPGVTNQLRLMRVWSALLSAGVVVAAWGAARGLWPSQPALARTAAGFILFLPMASFIGASANNDALVNLVAALLFWHAVRCFRAGWSLSGLVIAAALTLMLPLSKKLGLGLVPVGGYAVLAGLFTRLARRAQRWIIAGGAVAIVLSGALLFSPVLDQPASWARRGPERYGARTVGDAIHGNHVLILPAFREQAAAWIVQALPEAAARRLRGTPVTLRAWVRADLPATPADLEVDDGVRPVQRTVMAGPAWQEVVLSLRVAEDASGLRVRMARPAGASGGALYFDDVRLLGLGRQWLANPSAESPKRRWEGYAASYLRLPPWFLRGIGAPISYDAEAWRRFALYAVLMFPGFWGNFGWLNMPLPIWTYAFIALICSLTVWGALYAGHLWRQPWQRRVRRFLIAAVCSMAVAVLLPMVGRDWQPQGRYLFPGLVPLALAWASGWAGWGARWGWPRWWLVPVVLMATLALGSLVGIIIPHYYV